MSEKTLCRSMEDASEWFRCIAETFPIAAESLGGHALSVAESCARIVAITREAKP